MKLFKRNNVYTKIIFSGTLNDTKSSIELKSVIVNQNATEISPWNDSLINETYIPDGSSKLILFSTLLNFLCNFILHNNIIF